MSRWSKLAAGAGDFTRGFAQGLDGPGIGKIITEKRRRDEERGRYETGLQRENAKILIDQLERGTKLPSAAQRAQIDVLGSTVTGAVVRNIGEADRARRQGILDQYEDHLSVIKTLANTDPRKSWTLNHRDKANSTLTSLASLEREASERYPDMKLDRGPTGFEQFETWEEVFENHRKINTATTHSLQLRDLLLEHGGGLADELEALGYLHAANPDLMTGDMYAGRQESIRLQYFEKDFELALSKNLPDEAYAVALKSGNPALIRKAELHTASATKNNDITKIQAAIQGKMWDMAMQIIEDSEDKDVQGMRAAVVEYSEHHFRAADQLFYGRVEALADRLEDKHARDQKMVGGPLYFEGYQEGGTSGEIIHRSHWLKEARKMLVAGRGGAFASIGAQRASLRDPAPAGANIAQTFIAQFEEMVEDYQDDAVVADPLSTQGEGNREKVRAQAEAMMFHMSNSRIMSINEKEMIRSYFREMDLIPEGTELFPDSPEALAHTIRTPLAQQFMKDMVAEATDAVNQAYLAGGEESRKLALSDAMGAFVDASKVGFGTLINPNDVVKMFHLVEDATTKQSRIMSLVDDPIVGPARGATLPVTEPALPATTETGLGPGVIHVGQSQAKGTDWDRILRTGRIGEAGAAALGEVPPLLKKAGEFKSPVGELLRGRGSSSDSTRNVVGGGR